MLRSRVLWCAARPALSHRGLQGVIFDKDGTLLDAHATWAPVLRAACARMPEEDEKLFEILGFDSERGIFRPDAAFMTDTSDVIRALLRSHGVDTKRFDAEIERLLRPTDEQQHERPQQSLLAAIPLADTAALFRECRAMGLRVAVLTADDRANTLWFLEQEEVLATTDAVVCGDDGRGAKPSGEPIAAIAAGTWVYVCLGAVSSVR